MRPKRGSSRPVEVAAAAEVGMQPAAWGKQEDD